MKKTSRLPVTLTAPGERALRAGHPWLFDGAIRSVKGEGKAGDLAVVFSVKKNKCIGVGLYDPGSPIRIRVLHGGGPATVNEDFFRKKLAAAKELRTPLLATDTTGYRLVHGENDGLPGLVVDVYAGVCVLKLYSAAWLPWLDTLLPLILEVAGSETLVLRLARVVENAARASTAGAGLTDGAVLSGHLPEEELIFREHGRQFYANVVRGHKTGFFLDHRDNRKHIGELAEGKEVLDVFSYAGGFSVHALAGGATGVTSLDVSGPALEQASRNVQLNFGGDPAVAGRHQNMEADAFDGLAELAESEKTYDLVIVDPPSFAKSEKEIPGALAAYRKINRLAVPLVAPGGVLVAASCSARVTAEDFFKVIAVALQVSGRKHKLLDKTFHDVDHPVGFPEGAYLKTVYYRIY
ncbi:class I SAM-dependent rRNA methyltransferase [Neolewinella antarctica]|uniref:23S rRNA (Cytosine1962-C5)-methyltransferase n=1 Tax=Neolewinella antarctica TaxID=442734 RepID=A0ABX0XFC8_9BACT|nr:class I SAM-dependent rRNA methyltransferase [Neolewinella antarctica]NJC27452.1 23S rRNA (cytosine1962-C5)-methyltransferase [Neolewinella antarctica]